MKKLLRLCIMFSLAMTLCACGSNDDSSTDKGTDKEYKIAYDAKYAPFSMEIDGEYKGIDVELLAAIAEEEGFKYKLTPMDFSGIIPGLVSGQIDGSIAGMNITEERKKQVDFSDGYIESGSAIVVNKNNTDITSLETLKGKKAAVKKGTTGATFAEENSEKYGFTYDYYEDSPSMMMAVSNGNADFLVEDYPVITYQIKTGEQSKLKVAVDAISKPPMDAFAVKKGENQELLKMFNDGLAKIKENGKYDEIIGQYVD